MKNILAIIGVLILSAATLLLAWFALGTALAFSPVCEGWNEGTMAASSCVVDSALLMATYNTGSAILLFSSFMIGIPLVVFGIVSTLCAIIWFWIAFAVKKKQKNAIPPFIMAGVSTAATLSFAWPIMYMLIAVAFDL